MTIPAEGVPGAGLPLVSCIMPTADRRRFVPRAVHQFLAQDYPNKELVILDDDTSNFGGGQAILLRGEALVGGSDPRKDGYAAGL